MKTIEYKKIPTLFRNDIRNKEIMENFEKVFEIEITDLLSGYDYDEIDEFPIKIEGKGIMIGFIAETIKTPPQIEYIDLDIHNYSENMSYMNKIIPLGSEFLKAEKIVEYLTPYSNFRIYFSLYNLKQIEKIIFQHENLRYELLINEGIAISRVRICFNETESDINMRTYHPF